MHYPVHLTLNGGDVYYEYMSTLVVTPGVGDSLAACHVSPVKEHLWFIHQHRAPDGKMNCSNYIADSCLMTCHTAYWGECTKFRGEVCS